MIETQRLLSTSRSLKRHGSPRSRRAASQPTVVTYARDLARRRNSALAKNSRTSQHLDQSFPSRLFEQDTSEEDEGKLRKRYLEQLKLRARLTTIAIFDESILLELPERPLKPWELTVLRTYLDDADKKLQTFGPLLQRLELMRELINEKFLFKKLEYDQRQGFILKDSDSGMTVNLRQLSSGEQHEIVLLYSLLMNVKRHALVLIDEPEISLHVTWQNSFLDDLDKIASLTNLRFMIATHSPQIINTWWDQAVALYSTE